MVDFNRKNRAFEMGSQLTSKKLSDVAPCVMQSISIHYAEKPQLVLDTWPQIVGREFAPLTKATQFKEGILEVRVKNSSLMSLLQNPADKKRIIEAFRARIPGIVLKNIIFRIG
jgi:hypothetical protein